MSIFFTVLFLSLVKFGQGSTVMENKVDCGTLRMGQYMCPDPDVNYIQQLIDPKTQQLRGCTPENKGKGKSSTKLQINLDKAIVWSLLFWLRSQFNF